MEQLSRELYRAELIDQTQAVIVARSALDHTVAIEADPTRIWYHLRAFFAAAGSATRMVYPNTGGRRAKHRGVFLREDLGLPEDPPEAAEHARVTIEHLDERMDDWADAHADATTTTGTIGAIDPEVGAQLARHYDPGAQIVYIFGEILDVDRINADMLDIWARLDNTAS